MKIDFDQIRELLSIVSQTNITEITIEAADEKVTVKKAQPIANNSAIEVPAVSYSTPNNAAPRVEELNFEISKTESTNNDLVAITSPMVGTFYRSPSPTAPAFVDIGDIINVGQTICIIEAMKLMNDLPAEITGRIAKVCVENGTTVEYGQALFMIDPKG